MGLFCLPPLKIHDKMFPTYPFVSEQRNLRYSVLRGFSSACCVRELSSSYAADVLLLAGCLSVGHPTVSRALKETQTSHHHHNGFTALFLGPPG